MPSPPHKCASCPALCYGKQCSKCAHAVPGGTRYGSQLVRASVNSVGEFNAGGFTTGLAIGRHVNPTESEWIGKDREEFQAWCLANRNRMLRGTGGNWRPDAASQYWVF